MPTRIKGLRWWMIGLLMLGSIINYLTRSTLAVAAPTILASLHITTQEYSWIVGTFHCPFTPLFGSVYELDLTWITSGLARFAIASPSPTTAHGLANHWQTFAWLRGLL